MKKFRIDTNKLKIKELVSLRKIEYARIGCIPCPLLDNELVYFNSRGFFHLTHNGRGKLRIESDQRMRLNLLPSVEAVIKRANTFGSPTREMVGKDGKIDTYYELRYQFNENKTVAVVLRRTGNGRLNYYSVRYVKK